MTINPAKRNWLYQKSNYTCQYCHSKLKNDLTLDHINPKALGGSNDMRNLIVACKSCNSKKANKLPENYVTHEHAIAIRAKAYFLALAYQISLEKGKR